MPGDDGPALPFRDGVLFSTCGNPSWGVSMQREEAASINTISERSMVAHCALSLVEYRRPRHGDNSYSYRYIGSCAD